MNRFDLLRGDPVEISRIVKHGDRVTGVEWFPATICSIEQGFMTVAFADGRRQMIDLASFGWRPAPWQRVG